MNAAIREQVEETLTGIKAAAHSLRQSAYAIDDLDHADLNIDTAKPEDLRVVADAARAEAVRVVLCVITIAAQSGRLDGLTRRLEELNGG